MWSPRASTPRSNSVPFLFCRCNKDEPPSAPAEVWGFIQLSKEPGTHNYMWRVPTDPNRSHSCCVTQGASSFLNQGRQRQNTILMTRVPERDRWGLLLLAWWPKHQPSKHCYLQLNTVVIPHPPYLWFCFLRFQFLRSRSRWSSFWTTVRSVVA